MKFYYKIALCLSLVVSTAGMTSCNIDPEITDFYTEEIPWASPENMQLLINDFYPIIGGYYGGIAEDVYSDIIKSGNYSTGPNMLLFGNYSITPTSNVFDNWSNRYLWIQGINRFLSNLEKASEAKGFTRDVKLRAEAEMRCFRGILYFDLAKRYGGSVILFDELPELGNNDNPRSTADDCWDFIERDFDFAAQYLPDPKSAVAGKLTKGAAFGMKARAMLYAERWQSAVTACENLEKLNHYSLVDNYAELFKNTREANGVVSESVIEFGHIKDKLTYDFDTNFCPPGDNGAVAGFTPTENLVSQYEILVKNASGKVVATEKFDWSNPVHAANPYANREPRFYASILYNGALWKGRTIESFVGGRDGYNAAGGSTTTTGYYMRKLNDETMTNITPGWLTYYFMRYAEVLLIHAEAEAKLSVTRIDDAIKKVNKVRDRVGLPGVTATTLNEFMDHLSRERMIELAFEGHRYWDLRRWGNGEQTLTARNYGVKPEKIGENMFVYTKVDADRGRTRVYPKKYNRFPIPQVEINRNKALEQFIEWK